MTEQLVEAVARAILESDPTCDYDACREQLARDRFGLEQNWWEGLHRQARNAIAEVCKISNAETGMMIGDADVTEWLRYMAAERPDSQFELNSAADHIDHLRAIIAAQQLVQT